MVFILASVDVKNDVQLRFSHNFTMTNYSDLGFDVAVSTDTEQDISYEESEAEFPAFRGPWFNVVDPDAYELPEPDFRSKHSPGFVCYGLFLKFLKTNEDDIIVILVTYTYLYAQQQTAMKMYRKAAS